MLSRALKSLIHSQSQHDHIDLYKLYYGLLIVVVKGSDQFYQLALLSNCFIVQRPRVLAWLLLGDKGRGIKLYQE